MQTIRFDCLHECARCTSVFTISGKCNGVSALLCPQSYHVEA